MLRGALNRDTVLRLLNVPRWSLAAAPESESESSDRNIPMGWGVPALGGALGSSLGSGG